MASNTFQQEVDNDLRAVVCERAVPRGQGERAAQFIAGNF